ncbi:MAG: hypothetical protein OD811_02105 [Alphaproteobacteria bacterium]
MPKVGFLLSASWSRNSLRAFALSVFLATVLGVAASGAQESAGAPRRIEVPRAPPNAEARARAQAHADCYEWASAGLLNRAQIEADRDLSNVIGGDYGARSGDDADFQAWRHEHRLSRLMSECVARFDLESQEELR